MGSRSKELSVNIDGSQIADKRGLQKWRRATELLLMTEQRRSDKQRGESPLLMENIIHE